MVRPSSVGQVTATSSEYSCSSRPACARASREPSSFTLVRAHPSNVRENPVRDIFFILITLAIFAIFALIARGAEKL